jgi:hypothetical protein
MKRTIIECDLCRDEIDYETGAPCISYLHSHICYNCADELIPLIYKRGGDGGVAHLIFNELVNK